MGSALEKSLWRVYKLVRELVVNNNININTFLSYKERLSVGNT